VQLVGLNAVWSAYCTEYGQCKDDFLMCYRTYSWKCKSVFTLRDVQVYQHTL